MANEDAAGVQVYKRLVDDLLNRAAKAKPDKQIEPPLTETHLGESIWQLPSEDNEATKDLSQQTKLAAVEIAFREKFYRVLVRPAHKPSPQDIVNTLAIGLNFH
jgi:THO complex subunit 1